MTSKSLRNTWERKKILNTIRSHRTHKGIIVTARVIDWKWDDMWVFFNVLETQNFLRYTTTLFMIDEARGNFLLQLKTFLFLWWTFYGLIFLIYTFSKHIKKKSFFLFPSEAFLKTSAVGWNDRKGHFEVCLSSFEFLFHALVVIH